MRPPHRRRRCLALAVLMAAPVACASNLDEQQHVQVAKSVSESRPMSNEASDPPPPASVSTCPAGLLAARRGGSAPDRYSIPSDSERTEFSALIASLLGPLERASAEAKARTLGYRLEDVPEVPGALLLRELPTRRRGGGAYLVRPGAASRLVVQAPHTFFDEGTLPLACELFQRAGAAALFIDTAHRYKAAEPDERGDHPADVAHARDSLFQAATVGAINRVVGLTVVQIHGFAPRESGAAIVLSTGASELLAPLTTRARTELSPLVSGPVLRFPDECQELGATTNAQGAVVRAAGGRFLHVEMSARLRQTLLDDAALRARYLEALARSLELP
jgi:hypothetical protein